MKKLIEAGVNKVGPTLYDIAGRPVAVVQGYDYSDKMRAISKEWKVWDQKHRQLVADVKIPNGLTQLGVRDEDIPMLSTHALKDAAA